MEFPLADLHREIGRFGFISGYQTRTYEEEDPVNAKAAERMGRLYDALKAAGYDGHALDLLLVRLLFSCSPTTPASSRATPCTI